MTDQIPTPPPIPGPTDPTNPTNGPEPMTVSTFQLTGKAAQLAYDGPGTVIGYQITAGPDEPVQIAVYDVARIADLPDVDLPAMERAELAVFHAAIGAGTSGGPQIDVPFAFGLVVERLSGQLSGTVDVRHAATPAEAVR